MRRDLLLIAAASALILVPTLIVPVGPDQCALACAARRMLRANVLYVDIWNPYFGGCLVYSLILFLKESALAIRLFDMAWQFATALTIYCLALKGFDRIAALAAGIAYLLAYVETGNWSFAQTDALLNLPLLLALLCWHRAGRSNTLMWSAAAGACFGFGLTFRFTVATLALCAPVALSAGAGEGGARRRWWQCILGTTLGVALFVGAVVVFLTIQGNRWDIAGPFLPRFLRMNVQHGTGAEASALARGFWSGAHVLMIENNWLVAVGALVGLFAALLRARRAPRMWLPLVYTGAMLIAVVAMPIFNKHYWLKLLPPWALLCGCALDLRRERGALPPHRRQRLTRQYSILLLIPLCLSLPSHAIRWRDLLVYASSPRSPNYLHQFTTRPPFIAFSAVAESELASYLASHTVQNDFLFVWGYAPMALFLSGRDLPTPFMYADTFVRVGADAGWVREFVDAIVGNRPPFIVIRRDEKTPGESGHYYDASANEDDLPELRDFVRQHYTFERQFGYLWLYRRKESP